jgi:hypothetical protein
VVLEVAEDIICATITLIASITSRASSLEQLLPAYFRSLALFPKGPWIDDVYWTLTIEVGFYSLVFGLLCAGDRSY